MVQALTATFAISAGAVSFGPSEDNTRFVVILEARPEAVDEITNTALPLQEETVRYASNLVPIEQMPETVWHVGTEAKSNRSFYKDLEGLAAPPGHVNDGRFYTFYNLDELSDAENTKVKGFALRQTINVTTVNNAPQVAKQLPLRRTSTQTRAVPPVQLDAPAVPVTSGASSALPRVRLSRKVLCAPAPQLARGRRGIVPSSSTLST